MRLACALFECTFTNGRTQRHAFVYRCPEFHAVCLSILNSEMTGLLSVFSLLPVQTVKRQEGSREEAEEEEEPGGLKKNQARGVSPQEDGESSDTERYCQKFWFYT